MATSSASAFLQAFPSAPNQYRAQSPQKPRRVTALNPLRKQRIQTAPPNPAAYSQELHSDPHARGRHHGSIQESPANLIRPQRFVSQLHSGLDVGNASQAPIISDVLRSRYTLGQAEQATKKAPEQRRAPVFSSHSQTNGKGIARLSDRHEYILQSQGMYPSASGYPSQAFNRQPSFTGQRFSPVLTQPVQPPTQADSSRLRCPTFQPFDQSYGQLFIDQVDHAFRARHLNGNHQLRDMEAETFQLKTFAIKSHLQLLHAKEQEAQERDRTAKMLRRLAQQAKADAEQVDICFLQAE